MRKEQDHAIPKTPMARREFLHWCALCAGTIALPPGWAQLLAVAEQHAVHGPEIPRPGGGLAFRFFTAEQAAIVEAVTDQLIPADEDPGAKWAGVVHYIDLGLAADLSNYRSTYEEGIKRLTTLAFDLLGKSFIDLDFADQTRVIEKLEHDQMPMRSAISGREFFELVRKHTIEGFFSDPKYGGDRECVGWKVLKVGWKVLKYEG